MKGSAGAGLRGRTPGGRTGRDGGTGLAAFAASWAWSASSNADTFSGLAACN